MVVVVVVDWGEVGWRPGGSFFFLLNRELLARVGRVSGTCGGGGRVTERLRSAP